MFRFESPESFRLIILVPILLLISWLYGKWKQKKIRQSLGTRLTPFLTQSVSIQKRRWKLFLQSLCLLMMLLAWARPQMGQSQEKIKSEGIEVIFLVDVSDSMMAEDVKPNRLAQVKVELSRLIDLSPGNKIGIIAFAGSAALLCPLTNDPGAVKMYIESLSTSSVSSQGTNFEEALRLAKESFEHGGVSTDETSKATRVIVVASDGEDQEEGALEAAQKLSQSGIKIFTVAYGTEKGGAIPVRDGMGYLRGYKKDHQGQTVLSTVRGEFLQKLAQSGKGSFYFAVFGGSHVTQLNDDFDKLDKTLFDSQIATQYEEKFQIVLLFCFLFGIFEIILGDRKTNFRLWRGRFEVAKS
ncbi:MAG: VWA domain-containing protein [Bdellovibrionota bacterium]